MDLFMIYVSGLLWGMVEADSEDSALKLATEVWPRPADDPVEGPLPWKMWCKRMPRQSVAHARVENPK